MRIEAATFLRYFSVLLLVSTSCSEEDQVNKPPLAVIRYTDDLDVISLDGTFSKDKNHGGLTYEWSSSNENILIEESSQGKTHFNIPSGDEETSTTITLKVSDSKFTSEENVLITVPALTPVRSFGIGKTMTSDADNSPLYSWYLDQGNTGTFSGINCGPASVTMATKWADENFSNTVEDARNTYRSSGGWWYTNDIVSYLNLKNVSNWIIALSDMNVVKEEIDNDHIVILCLDMYYVNYPEKLHYRVGKFYTTANPGWGHFIVVKGYKVVDGKLFFETYDPYSLDQRYDDQTLKGMNRYYSGSDLNQATQIWWDYAIVIAKSSSEGKRRGIEVGQIVHKPGR